jgi:hypothetical protein
VHWRNIIGIQPGNLQYEVVVRSQPKLSSIQPAKIGELEAGHATAIIPVHGEFKVLTVSFRESHSRLNLIWEFQEPFHRSVQLRGCGDGMFRIDVY